MKNRKLDLFNAFWLGWILLAIFAFSTRLFLFEFPAFLSPEVIDPLLPPLQSPSWRHWWGTDELGRDVLVRLIFGTSYSLLFALPVALTSACLATFIGVTTSFLSLRMRIVLVSFSDVVSTLPLLPLILIALVIYPGQIAVIALLKISLGWTALSQLVYLESTLLLASPIVLSARSQGISSFRIGLRFVTPQLFNLVKGYVPFLIFSNIFTLSSLDYFGLGYPIPTPTLAECFRQFQENPSAWWLFVFPLVILTLILRGFRQLATRNN